MPWLWRQPSSAWMVWDNLIKVCDALHDWLLYRRVNDSPNTKHQLMKLSPKTLTNNNIKIVFSTPNNFKIIVADSKKCKCSILLPKGALHSNQNFHGRIGSLQNVAWERFDGNSRISIERHFFTHSIPEKWLNAYIYRSVSSLLED